MAREGADLVEPKPDLLPALDPSSGQGGEERRRGDSGYFVGQGRPANSRTARHQVPTGNNQSKLTQQVVEGPVAAPGGRLRLAGDPRGSDDRLRFDLTVLVVATGMTIPVVVIIVVDALLVMTTTGAVSNATTIGFGISSKAPAT